MIKFLFHGAKESWRKMRIDKEISKNEAIVRNPTESGWYVCSVAINSVTFYDETDKVRHVDYVIAEYELCLLYWESNVWVVHPRSYQTVEERNIISWTKVPDNYFQTVKINYLQNK